MSSSALASPIIETWVLGTPETMGYVLRERRDEQLCETLLQIQWEDRCSLTCRLRDEVRASYHGDYARQEAIWDMERRHAAECQSRLHSPLCGTGHGFGTCGVCGTKKEWARIQTLGQPDYWLCLQTGERKFGSMRLLDDEGSTRIADGKASYLPGVRRYCALEG